MKRKIGTTYLIAADIFLLSLSMFISILIRFEGIFPVAYREMITQYWFNILVIKIAMLYIFRLYNSLWIYASIEELVEIVTGVLVANGAVIIYFTFVREPISISILVLNIILDIMLLGGFRLSYRILRRIKSGKMIPLGFCRMHKKRILVIGGGDAGAMVIKELRTHEGLNSHPIAIIDDDDMKKGKIINGVPVVGNRNDIYSTVKNKKIDEIIIAMPSATKKEIAQIVKECKLTDAKIKTLPGVFELIDGKISISQIREVDIEDLLGREPVQLDTDNVEKFLKNKTVIVTGGAGSIGSELARQISKYKPKKLILFDLNENGLYDLEHELKTKYNQANKTLDFEVIIASVRDIKRLEQIFDQYRPEVVFHAAAHKHVPLMEASPHEAVKNNVFGTLNLVRTADKYKVEKFVQISTDKAVNPTNVMGATKRICELIIQTYNQESSTEFAAVRFGNVLGSNGSVIPLFKKQIAEGGPVTVTHPDVIRYFMTIPEAAQLVMQAGAMAKGGEIFILDMGEPVKIIDLAHDLIRLSGYTPDEDVDIKITGLRPGEKLFEELLLSEEGLEQTPHNKIHIGKPQLHDMSYLTRQLIRLKELIETGAGPDIREGLKSMVPEYTFEKEESMSRVIEFKRIDNR